jgi:hypothetical protein
MEEYACLHTRAREAVSAELRNDIRRIAADHLQSLHDLDVHELAEIVSSGRCRLREFFRKAAWTRCFSTNQWIGRLSCGYRALKV